MCIRSSVFFRNRKYSDKVHRRGYLDTVVFRDTKYIEMASYGKREGGEQREAQV